MYYEKEMGQQEIADKLHISRVKVSRSLKKAREEGIVRFNIDYRGAFLSEEDTLKKIFGLKDVIIVDNALDNDSSIQIQKTSAELLSSKIKNNDIVAVGWGTTIRGVANHMHSIKASNLTFAPIIGGHSSNYSHIHSSNIAEQMALATNEKAMIMNAPALVNSTEEKEMLMKNNTISSVINQTSNANIAIFSLGNPLYESSTIHNVNYFSNEQLKEIENNHVVCDFVSIAFLNKNGQEMCKNISNNSIGVKIDDLLNIPQKICVVYGQNKHISTLAALKAKYIDILITDKETADYLLNSQ